MFGRKNSADGPTEAKVLEALRVVMDPDLRKDIVTLGFVKNLSTSGGKVRFDVELTTPACPIKKELEEQARAAVAAIPGVTDVEVKMTSMVRQRVIEERPLIPGVKNTIAVASGKGGVGKSTVAVNLALALAQSGASVGLMDADVYGPSIPIMFGVRGQPEMKDNQLVPVRKYGISLMSIGFLAGEDAPIIWRGPMVGKLIQQFLGQVAWGDLDYLVIDLPPGTGDAQLTLAQSAPLSGAVIVTTPQDVALEDVTRAVRMFEKVEVPILGVVENMSFFVCPHCGGRSEIFDHGGGEKAAARYEVPFLGAIPLQTAIRVGGDRGDPIVHANPDAPESEAFRNLAGLVAHHLSTVTLQNAVHS
jgi:ATP-binding protein involved in chromosome partitioning